MLSEVSADGVSDFIKGHATIVRSCLDYLKIGGLDHYVLAKHHRNVDADRRKQDHYIAAKPDTGVNRRNQTSTLRRSFFLTWTE